MAIKVLVVDDSSFFRRRVSEIINADPRLSVVDVAINGKEAIAKAITLKPDVITMDIEMPVMDGISAVREIMSVAPTPILMFSSLTHEGATATLDALEAGALDFIPKKFEDIARNREEAVLLLQQRVKGLVGKRFLAACHRNRQTDNSLLTADKKNNVSARMSDNKVRLSERSARLSPTPVKTVISPITPVVSKKTTPMVSASGKSYRLTAIGTSTGGPVALQTILTQLPKHYPHPILLIQHMPATFTTAFANRLNSLCKINVREACDGDILKPGVAYLAPGGMQMMVDGHSATARLRILDGGERMNYKPSVDITFGSAAKIYKDKVLSVVLTGMGADGREGARMLKNVRSTVWAQDENSCVVYGMPQAVVNAGLSSESLPLDMIAKRMIAEVGL